MLFESIADVIAGVFENTADTVYTVNTVVFTENRKHNGCGPIQIDGRYVEFQMDGGSGFFYNCSCDAF